MEFKENFVTPCFASSKAIDTTGARRVHWFANGLGGLKRGYSKHSAHSKLQILVKYIKRVGSLRKASVRLEREGGGVPAWESNTSSMSPFVRMLDVPLVKLEMIA